MDQLVAWLNEVRSCASVTFVQRTIGSNIREQRNRLGLTQEDLAARTSIGVTRISDLERNRYRTPDTPTLMKLAEALGCTIDDLLFGPDEDLRKDVNQWPLVEYVREQMGAVQPYPDAQKWKTVVTAYERIISRGTTLLKAMDDFATAIGGDGAPSMRDAPDVLLPDTLEGRPAKRTPLEDQISQQDNGRDLSGQHADGQSSPHLSKGDAVDPASAHRIERLEEEIAVIKAKLSSTEDVKRRLVRIAAGEKGHAARKSRTKLRKRNR